MRALEGMRVLDVSQIMAGPYCSMVLADMGAEVIKIEKPEGGDDSRQMGPYINGESTCFFQINRNKKSVCINLKEQKGKDIFYQLAETADVIIENFRPGVVRSLKIDYDTIRQLNPGIIYCSISGFGQTGPYANQGGFDLIVQGMSGLMNMTGIPGERPMKTGIAVFDIGAGLTAVNSILMAYIHKQKTGAGQHVDVSLLESGLAWFIWEAAAYFANGTIPQPTGSRHRVSAPYQAYRTQNGYVMLGGANQRTWEKFCAKVVERPEWLKDSRFLTNADRSKNVKILEELIEDVFLQQDSKYWIKKSEEAGVPCGPINNFAEALNDPHVLARGMVQEVEHPIMGKMRTLGIPVKFSLTPGKIEAAPPLLGQHTDQVLSSLQWTKEQLDELREQGVIR